MALLVMAGVCAAAPSTSLAATFSGPLLTGPPTITGSPVVGQTLTASVPIAATAPATTSTKLDWQRCDAAGANCATTGATAPTYALSAPDAGSKIMVVATVTDGAVADDSTGTSDLTATVTPPPVPATITSVTVTPASPTAPETLTAHVTTAGDPPITLSYQWSRCDADGLNCGDLTGATAQTHAVGGTDGGFTFRVTATATNATPPAATQTSPATARIRAAPALTQLEVTGATNTGAAAVGSVLTAVPTATGFPAPTFTYQWRRCTSTNSQSCVPISGATAAAYTATLTDAGFGLRVVVAAANGVAPTATRTSNEVRPITASPALSTPTISGVTTVGQTLQAGATVGGSPTPTVIYQWQRCTAAGTSCADIPLATGAQYTLLVADLGDTIRVNMTASNGTPPDATALSAPTDVIQAAATAGPPFDTSSSGTSAPATVAAGTTPTGSPAPAGTVAGTSRARVLTPFPLVRLRGRLASTGAFVTLFSVTAPKGAKVVIRCKGKGCPKKTVSFVARKTKTRVEAFQVLLPAGVRLSVRVSRPGYVGKITTFVIHANRAPARTDRCLTPTTGKVVACSA